MRRTTFLILLLLNAALVALLAALWYNPGGGLRNSHWEPPRPQHTDYRAMLPPVGDSVPVNTSQFVVLLERPLFAANRRPPPPPPPPEPVVAALVDNLSTARLMGIFQSSGAGGVIIRVAGADKRLRVSESIEGWVLQSISGNTVTFAGRGQTRTLTLQRASLTSGGAAPTQGAFAAPRSPSDGSHAASAQGVAPGSTLTYPVAAPSAAQPAAAPPSPAPADPAAGAAGSPDASRPPAPRAVFGGTRR